MNNSEEAQNVGRVSISGRIIDLLWMDDEFYREVSALKKASSSNKFPRGAPPNPIDVSLISVLPRFLFFIVSKKLF